jgi:hypothetical protein
VIREGERERGGGEGREITCELRAEIIRGFAERQGKRYVGSVNGAG